MSTLINPLFNQLKYLITQLPYEALPQSMGTESLIRWDYGVAMGILGSVTAWLFWRLNKLENEHQKLLANQSKSHQNAIDVKDAELKELNEKLLEAFVAVQTTLSIVGENNNTMMQRMEKILEDHRTSMENLIK